jgi:tol-pal system protein YbgF
MRIVCQLKNGVLGLLMLTSTPFLFAATNDAIMVESRNGPVIQQLPFQAPIEDVSPAAVIGAGIDAEYQSQLVEQEVQALRGLVEDLQYQLKRMKKIQDDRYLELDSRFQSLRAGLASGSVAPGSAEAVIKSDEEAVVALPVNVVQGEKSLYDTALELIRNRQYDLAVTQLQAVIEGFPNGDYAPNAYYWLGEVYAAMPVPKYENARQAFVHVITFFPDHRKVPDAAFKLGKVHHLIGDCDKAKELLNKVVEQYQGKSVAKLAAGYLRDGMINCQS